MTSCVYVYVNLTVLAFAAVFAACGKGEEQPRLTPDAQVQQQTGIELLPEETTNTLIDPRPPIDEFDTPYLFPHEHPDLPVHIADWLSERGYVIPQNLPEDFEDQDSPINVITGEFIHRNQTDLAVYCTNRKTTGIIIFKNSKVEDIEIVDTYPQSKSQFRPEGVPIDCCFEYIFKVSPEDIYSIYLTMRKYRVLHPPPLYHDGIYVTTSIYFKFEEQWYSMQASE